jgi:patatin-like phospholipase/acyl hydrolase
MSESYTYDTLILSGGGAKGLCILGAIQCLQDLKKLDVSSIKNFIGTSIGSVISFFLCIGCTPVELVVWICSHAVLENMSLNNFDGILKGDGIYNYNTLNETYKKLIYEKMEFIPTMRDIREKFGKNLTICTYNFTNKEPVYITSDSHPNLSCLDAIRMSSNLPFIFSPFWYEKCEYVDGGVLENFSFTSIPNLTNNEAKETSDDDDSVKLTIHIKHAYSNICGIAIKDISADEKDQKMDELHKKYNKITNLLDKMYELLMIPRITYENEMIKHYKDQINFIQIPVKGVKLYTFDFTNVEKLDMFSTGYNAAKEFSKKV